MSSRRPSFVKVLILTIVAVFVIPSVLSFTDFWRKTELNVPDAYYQFIIDYAPYLHVIPGTSPDLTSGKAALAAAFAVRILQTNKLNRTIT